MTAWIHFPIFILVSLLAFVSLLKFILRHRATDPSWARVSVAAVIVVIGGMLFAKFGANFGLPWWIYYGAPVLLTLALPPIAFAMNRKESVAYIELAFLVSPLIHAVFSFFFGWKEYMPFIPVPSMWELL
jgi:hypothetical protein